MADLTDPPPPTGAVAARPTDVPWYSPDLEAISPAARELLEKYSGIPAEEVLPHVLKIRSLAFAIHPYPCIGSFRFLTLSISTHPLYPTLLTRLHSPTPPTVLDLGCCFGQDIRQLLHDGAPPTSLYGSDLRPAFLELGYTLFRDGDKAGATYVAADVFGEGEADALRGLDGRVDVVWTASFLHLFAWAEQVAVGRRVGRLLRGGKGGVVFGRQVGSVRAGEYPRRTGGGSMYRHDGESFKRMWAQIGRETGTEWRVEVQMEEVGRLGGGGGGRGEGLGKEGARWNDEDTRMLRFEVERIL
ncbi:hypothetical protein MMC17_004939 [Xylographa soralifera]|nr:hypothetical protein [Xylographa soralifera]